MKIIQFTATENEMANFKFDELNTHVAAAKEKIANATSVADVTTSICNVWSRVRKYVIWAENIPVAGKFITILADLLDTICPAG